MASRHRITRHDMKQDEFVSTVGRITRWAEENVKLIAVWVGGVLATVVLVFGFWAWRENRFMAGEAALSGAVEAYAANVGAEGTSTTLETFPTRDEKYRAVLERADEVIRDHGSTPSGERARYYRGLALFETGDRVGARAALEEFVDRNARSFLAPHARRKIAIIDESEGNLQQACDSYRELTDVDVLEFPTEMALIDLGRCLRESGSTAEAIEAYQRIVDDYPGSTYASDAQQRLQELQEAEGQG